MTYDTQCLRGVDDTTQVRVEVQTANPLNLVCVFGSYWIMLVGEIFWWDLGIYYKYRIHLTGGDKYTNLRSFANNNLAE